MKNTALCFNNEKGAVVILVAILIPVLLGVVAFAIDIGYTRIVRNQLQNAADATALAACNHFYDRTVPNFSNPDDLIPKWNDAVTESASAITDNTSDNHQLETCTTAVGWWDFTQAYPGSMWPNALSTSPPNTPPTADYGPAAMVTVTKTSGQNSGPVSSFFGKIFGFTSYDNGATATAVAASPGSVRPDAVIPFAISKTVLDKNDWEDHDENTPEELFAIGSDYHYPDSEAGQWTSFMTDANDVPYISNLITNGNPVSVSIGDNIWIQPGTENTLYAQQPKGNVNDAYSNWDIVCPIVDGPMDTHAMAEVKGFVGFHIICAGKGCKGQTFYYNGEPVTVGANEPMILGYFTTAPVYGGPLGPHYGPLDRCRLCK